MPRQGRKPASGCRRVRFRGRELGSAEVAWIRKLVRAHPDANRSALSRLVCCAWDWRQPNGELRVRSGRNLLVRLSEEGHIVLPASQRRARPDPKSRGCGAAGVWDSVPRSPEPGAIDLRAVTVRPITTDERGRWREGMARFHYLGDGNIVGKTQRYVAEIEGEWLALLGWGAAALKSRHREQYVGWDEKTKYQRLHLVANNVRFLILPWIRVPHLASRVLATNLKRLSGDWEARYGHPILLAETFVDLARFQGTAYRASNWIYLGQTRGMGRKGAGYERHGQPKGLFVYPVHRRARALLSAVFPAPQLKGSTAMPALSIDVNRLPLEGRDGLLDVLRKITDPRKARGIRHPIASVLTLATLAVLSGMRSYESIAEWAADLPKDLLKRLRCWCWRAPSEPTFRRIMQSVNAEEIDAKIGEWLARQGALRGKDISIDGKTLRGSRDGDQPAVHLLSAITHGTGVVFAQKRVSEKSNEITATQPLLDAFDLKGATVTADALHTQRNFANYLVEEKGADYILIVKGNQPTLSDDIRTVEWDSFSPSGQHNRQGPRPHRSPQDLAD